MYEIARAYPDETTSSKVISEKQNVSIPFLEQILSRLRKAKLIKSIKGPGGGYQLIKPPGNISIASIVNELEGPVAITSCLNPEEGCIRVDSCVVHLLWKGLGRQIEDFLNTITLQDLINGEIYNDQIFMAQSRGLNKRLAEV